LGIAVSMLYTSKPPVTRNTERTLQFSNNTKQK
jgi:hypothetical protein